MSVLMIVLGLTVEVVVGACASAPGVNNRHDIKAKHPARHPHLG